MRRIKILAWLAALLLPLRALAETCTLPTGTYNWTAACTVSAGTITGCTCNASDADIWEIPQDAIVTIPGDATVTDLDVTMSSATAQIIVRAGGQLTLAAAGGLGVPGAGLLVEPLGIFRSQGRALTYGNATPAYSAAALAQSTVPTVNTALAAGEIIHCPGTSTSTLVEDCEANDTTPGSPAQIAICWPNADDATARRQGYQVTTALKVEAEAVAAAAPDLDLILMDISGEEEEGYRRCRALRQRLPETPIILMTGATLSEVDKRLGFEAGADGFLVKCSLGSELIPAVEAVLRGERYVSSRSRRDDGA